MNAKTDNTNADAKAELRNWVIDELADTCKISVLDLYAGRSGQMYQKAWFRADGYLGVDVQEPHTFSRTIRASALKTLRHVRDQYTIIDIDPYANPWKMLHLAMKKQAVRGIVITACDGRTMKNGHSGSVYGFLDVPDTTLAYRFAKDIYLSAVVKIAQMTCRTIDKCLYLYLDDKAYFYCAVILKER